MAELRLFECDCCGREVVARKKPGIGYVCDPCLRCFAADPPMHDERLPPEAHGCYYRDDLEWMQAMARKLDWEQEDARKRRRA